MPIEHTNATANPFGPLTLTRQDEEHLKRLAQHFVSHAIAQYHTHMYTDHGHVSSAQWKFLAQREDISVYEERTKVKTIPTFGARTRAFTTSSTRCSIMGHTRSSLSVQRTGPVPSPAFISERRSMPDTSNGGTSELPTLLTVGTMTGDMYDAMYAAVCPTAEKMRIRSSYTNDHIVNAAVLASIHKPTPEQPFRSLGIHWAIKDQGPLVRTLVKNRDLVYLEATGLIELPSPESVVVGYHLIHSVHFPLHTPKLSYATRGNVSICVLYRQQSERVVHVFAKGYLNPCGRIMRSLVMKSATEVMISVWKYMLCGENKKLSYAMRHLQSLPSTQALESTCRECATSLSSRLLRRQRGKQCQLCMHYVCSTCQIHRVLNQLVRTTRSTRSDYVLQQQSVVFCLSCVTKVGIASAYDIAVDEIQHDNTTQ